MWFLKELGRKIKVYSVLGKLLSPIIYIVSILPLKIDVLSAYLFVSAGRCVLLLTLSPNSQIENQTERYRLPYDVSIHCASPLDYPPDVRVGNVTLNNKDQIRIMEELKQNRKLEREA